MGRFDGRGCWVLPFHFMADGCSPGQLLLVALGPCTSCSLAGRCLVLLCSCTRMLWQHVGICACLLANTERVPGSGLSPQPNELLGPPHKAHEPKEGPIGAVGVHWG